MLRSYQYSEKSFKQQSMQSNLFREKEIEIARKYVLRSIKKNDMDCECPVCKKTSGKYFYTKWDIDYLCCEECKSIFAACDFDEARAYQADEDLLKLRLSNPYQDKITENRTEMWTEFLEWIEVRAYRFLRKNKGLNIIDVGNRLKGYSQIIKDSDLCGCYDIRQSILCEDTNNICDGDADIVFYFDQMQKEITPHERLKEIWDMLDDGGLLFLGTRVGSGFDILTLKEKNKNIYPYEHIFLPSVKGIEKLLMENGFEVLEITTPGVMDVKYVYDSIDELDDREGFVKYLLTESEESVLQDFQRFLQKGCLSSFVRIIARKVG